MFKALQMHKFKIHFVKCYWACLLALVSAETFAVDITCEMLPTGYEIGKVETGADDKQLITVDCRPAEHTPPTIGDPSRQTEGALASLIGSAAADLARFFDSESKASLQNGWSFSIPSAKDTTANQVDTEKESTDCPVLIGSGEKILHEIDYVGTGEFPLEVSRQYNSRSQVFGRGIFGRNWHSLLDLRLRTNYVDNLY